ncbi:MAG: DUF1508 domain-containing protein [Ignavibacteriales bacterium]|nr:DUF1508 domain-containing protein [Ignavibacteriales bacterium]
MDEITLYIEKERELKESENYSYLRSKGLEYIQELANKIWTDYNIHDPGITILEDVSYAITDLGYRTNYLIKDILAEGTSAGSKAEKQFFTAREILTCNPVTINDYRKILIDVDGVRNGWLEIEQKVEPQIYIDCPNSRLTTNPGVKNVKPVDLRGLYNVILELDDDDELGDLNIYCFERIIEAKGKKLEIEISLPSWDVYFKENKIPVSFEFSELTNGDESLTYKGILKALFETGTLLLNYKAKLSEARTDTNKKLIEKELKRTDKDSLAVHYLNMITKAFAIAKETRTVLHAKRNLCEDFYSFKAVDVEEVIVCADIEVKPQADVSETLASIYYELEKFIAPTVNFYSIKEMYGKGKRTEEIFEGPILNYGFIDEDELENSDFKKVIHISDLIRIIMDQPEVTAVKNILLSSYYKCGLITEGEKWCLKIGEGRAPRFCINKSKIVFYKGLIPLSAGKDEMENKLKELKLLDRPKRLSNEEYDLSIPSGTNKEIQNYYSIQNDFPLCYGIGVEGLPLSSEAKRKAQAKQLKAYFLFFDQILADYFAQLAHAKDLFSLNSEIKRTYFSHNLLQNKENNLTEIPNIQNLFKEFVDTLGLPGSKINVDDFSTFEDKWNNFIALPQNNPPVYERDDLRETVAVYEDRRSRFLDHLMARFAEQFSDYAALMYMLDRMKAPSELIADKISFLKDYPLISCERGKAFNYKDAANLWNTANVSGLEKRASRLLGINSFKRKTLAECLETLFKFYQEKDEDGIDEFRFRLIDENGNILLSSSTKYYSMADAQKEKDSVIHSGLNKNNYVIKKTKSGKFYIVLTDDAGEIIARVIRYFKKIEEAEEFVSKIISYMEKSVLECEGFHLIEHILLRPRTADDKLLTVCVSKDCKSCRGFIDPYSFRVTVVVPYWHKRFKNMDFRKYFETTMRMEAPAHVHVKICWVDEEAMKNFESKYLPWLKEISKENPDQTQLSIKQKKLIEALESLRSVYPESRLYDCGTEDLSNVALLNHSILGSTKEEENDSM